LALCRNFLRRSFSARAILCFALCADISISLIELGGAWVSGSLALWSNCVLGVYDALLLSANIWALGHQLNHRPVIARKVAHISDIALMASCGAMACFAGWQLLDGAEVEEVRGSIVIMVAIAAMVVNFACALFCPVETENGGSARFKLLVGGTIASATIIGGVAIWRYHWFWADPALTLAIGISAVVIGAIRVRRALRT
jgi:Co/Zn/Cd efflux system component